MQAASNVPLYSQLHLLGYFVEFASSDGSCLGCCWMAMLGGCWVAVLEAVWRAIGWRCKILELEFLFLMGYLGGGKPLAHYKRKKNTQNWGFGLFTFASSRKGNVFALRAWVLSEMIDERQLWGCGTIQEAEEITITKENIHVNSLDFAGSDDDVVVEVSPFRVVRADVDVEGDEEGVVIMEEIDSLILSQPAVDVN
ncbi:hypothetical protein Cgig2_025076 [Carnegiea gigantea]|uniref:Uncharacterized protein n=1 Tax=Carnegiea gigantea TaxID=171969 RepID=A0A9Q1JQT7_9CARY|nr:hypothetical protein Cgig2_025076 [Carnegiea gigantea]